MKQIKTILQNNGAGTERVSATTMPQAQPAVASQDTKPAKTDYNGTPYSLIVEALLARWGIFGEPAEGNRNTTLYRLVRELRYICDFNAACILAVTPEWGLPAEERRQTVNSALQSPRGTHLPDDLKAVLGQLGDEVSHETGGEAPELNPMPKKLPFLLAYFVQRYRLNWRCVLMASLPILGNLLSRLRSQYLDGQMESPIFLTAIVGSQASGKSFINELYNVLAAPMLEEDQESLRLEEEYKEKVRRAKNAKNQPERETFPLRCIPSTVSNTQLLRRAAQNNGLSLLSFAPEIDTVLRSCKAGAWAQKSDIYRIGFEAGLYGQDFANENAFAAMVRLRYNLLFSGTDMAMKNFFKNVENGMNSRFCFAQMADDRGQKIQFKPHDSKKIKRVEQEVRRLYELGSDPNPENTITFKLRRTLEALDKWTDERIAEYYESGNEALDILRRRSCLIGFRAGMVAWALEGCRETPKVTDFALWVATETLLQQMAFFGHSLNKQDEENRQIRERGKKEMYKTKNIRLLSELPDPFTKSDLVKLRRKYGMEGECAYIITRWLKAGFVDYEGKQYKKIATPNDKTKNS